MRLYAQPHPLAVSFMPSEQSLWFASHVQIHEAVLRGWLQNRFSMSAEIDDIVQEAYLRILRAHESGELKSPKAFLFATARNLAMDHFRRHRTGSWKCLMESDTLTVLDEDEDTFETVARKQELDFLTEAIQALPARCRQVFTLRKIYGLSPPEIAEQLGISEHTVSAQLAIGLHKCTDYFSRYRNEKVGRHE